jgi:multiple sugar transport system substrate-binding protein
VRAGLVKALDGYTAIRRKGCTPPDAVDWNNYGNNKAFLEQRIVMTTNTTLSIPNAVKATRPEDYDKNVVTLEWPSGAHGQPLAIVATTTGAVVFKAGGHLAAAEEFVRFLVGEGWLAHWLDFAGDRFLPPMPALLETPFWLNPGDPHRMATAIQFLTRPRTYNYASVSGEWRRNRITADAVWPTAVHRVVADGLSPERAVDETIARVHRILGE